MIAPALAPANRQRDNRESSQSGSADKRIVSNCVSFFSLRETTLVSAPPSMTGGNLVDFCLPFPSLSSVTQRDCHLSIAVS